MSKTVTKLLFLTLFISELHRRLAKYKKKKKSNIGYLLFRKDIKHESGISIVEASYLMASLDLSCRIMLI